MESILIHNITPDEFFAKMREILREEIKVLTMQDQLLTKEGAMKLIGMSNATFLRAVAAGLLKPQLIKGRKKAMYLESEVLKLQGKKPKDIVIHS